jgi:CRISPR system Cascade subunit CasD
MAVLYLRVAGPMQSWGTTSRFTNRDTGLEPSKSGVIGLLCAALGKPRDEHRQPDLPTLADLARLRMGVRVDRQGTVERDYHTAGGTHWKDDEYGVRRSDGKPGTAVTSDRFYLADARFLVALEGDDDLLARLHEAIKRPVWQLSLGRKAFVPDPPVYLTDGLVTEPVALETALASYSHLCRPYPHSPDRLRTEIEVGPGEADRIKHDQPL